MWFLSLIGCRTPEAPVGPSPLLEVPEEASWLLEGLENPAYVVWTEGRVPNIYAHDAVDLARVQGFVIGRDRFFEIDLARRLALGEVAALLGEDALATDLESRGTGMTYVAGEVLEGLSDDQEAVFGAFAEGVNAYIAAVVEDALPAPSEYQLAFPLLGAESPTDLMQPFATRDVAAIAATLVYQLGFETGDVGRAASAAALDGLFADAALSELRQAGLIDDIWSPVAPVYDVSSSPGWRSSNPAGAVPGVVLERLSDRLDALQNRLGRDHATGWGSNAWAVTAAASADGRALLAGDGHLPLSVPSLFYRIGLNTRHLGGGDLHQVGLVIPGMPLLAVGTNGSVAWSQTQLFGDITDWYAEQLELDAAGAPKASLFQGAWQELLAFDEVVEVAEVPVLGSVGRTETVRRWTTFDGRWLTEIEGRSATEEETLGEGESLVRLLGAWVVPEDLDGDGIISAVSFDYTGLDAAQMMGGVEAFGHAADVREFQEATRRLVGYSQNITVADSAGSVFYTGYQAVPCRSQLERDLDGWAEGADPGLLLDGTRYGGFAIPVDADGVVDESQASDPSRCVVPFDAYPQVIDPASGYVLTANNDPGEISTDDSLMDDPWYIGGPWLEGYRAQRIDTLLRQATSEGWADAAGMATIQGDHRSMLGAQFTEVLLSAIQRAREADDPVYAADGPAMDEVQLRLEAWAASDFPARSGVATFYSTPQAGDEAHAVATMLFNAWFPRFVGAVFNDEGFPGVWRPTGMTGVLRALTQMIDGRGPDNPLELASWNPDTEESAFFDVLGTDQVELSEELAVDALSDALAFLRSAPSEGVGGFDTDDMEEWLWGLRHVVVFESILAEFLGDDPTYSILTDPFSITTDRLPLADGLTSDDPRSDLRGFPRHGDNLGVDAGNSGLGGVEFDYGSGPVFRMVIALSADGVEAHNIIPGGQSGLTDSPVFDDQAAQWLGNETTPMPFDIDEVIDAALARDSFGPGPDWW